MAAIRKKAGLGNKKRVVGYLVLFLLIFFGLWSVVWLGRITEVGSTLRAGAFRYGIIPSKEGLGGIKFGSTTSPQFSNAPQPTSLSRQGGGGFGDLPDSEQKSTGFSIRPGSGGGGGATCISSLPELTADYLETLSPQEIIQLLECFGADNLPLSAVISIAETNAVKAEVERREVNSQMSEQVVISTFLAFG